MKTIALNQRRSRPLIRGLMGVLNCTLLAALPLTMTTRALAAADDAASFPDHQVRLIIPSSPSGGTDFVARALAQRLTTLWKHPVVPENYGGAGGLVGLQVVARAAPDGYTLTSFNVGQIVAAQLNSKLSFGAHGNFTPIARTATSPQLLVAWPGLKVHSVPELVALARAKPQSINYGSTGIGGTTHLAMQAFLSLAGIQMTHVPYKGTAPVIPDLMSGRVQVAMVSPPSAEQLVHNGSLIALAITGDKRVPSLPNVPTFAEVGFPSYDMSTWFGVLGPAGMPPALVAKINRDVNQAMQGVDLTKLFENMGIDLAGGLSPTQVNDYMAHEAVKWNQAAQDAHMELH